MLGISKVIVAIRKKLNKAFPKIEVQMQDIEEGFKRPSFFIELANIKNKDFMKNFKDNSLTVRIIYFPSHPHKNQLELLKMMDELDKIFIEDNILELDVDFRTEIYEADKNVVDKVLHYNFDIYFSEQYIKEMIEIEMMENLEFKMDDIEIKGRN